MLLRRVLPLAFVLPLSTGLGGCDLFGLLDQTLDLPIELESPPQDFDVGSAVTEAEGSACSAADSASCVSLTAICQTENGRNCTPASMPDEFPGQVTVGADVVDANQLMADIGIKEATEIQVAVPVDTASALADEGVESPDLVKSVSIDAMALAWPENTLTFDAPPLDLYIAAEDLGEGAVDAAALIAAGTVTKVGTIGIDTDGDGTFDIGQAAGSTADVPMEFDDEGKEALNAAVKGGKFTIVTAVPDGAGLTLKTKDGDPATVRKPNGAGKIALKATLVYKVSANDIIGAGQ